MEFRARELASLMLIGSVLPGAMLPTNVMASDKEQHYPQRAITIVVGYPPGGGSDILARILARHMESELGQKVLVENRPGASSNIAADSVAHAAPDGYTLYIGTRPNTIHKSMYGHFNYDFATDLMPVGLLATVPNVLVASKQAPISTVKEVIALAKTYPGVPTIASTGVGSDTHLLGELFQQETQTKLLHVPYRGGTAALADVIGGRVDMLIFSLPGVLPHVKSGSVRALALLSRQRAPAAAQIPTMEEAGVLGLDVETWFGLMTPKGTPPQVIARLNGSLNVALMRPDLQKSFMAAGYVAPLSPNTPETFQTFIATETERWAAMIRDRNIKPVQ
jgi:tripartite-type tricarboxylate transporter receptor subunit TctC